MTNDSVTGSMGGDFKSASARAFESSDAHLPDYIMTISAPEYGDKPKVVYCENGSDYYIKNGAEQVKIDYDVIASDLGEKNVVKLPVSFNDPDFAHQTQMQKIALAYESGSTSELSQAIREFSGTTQTPSVAFAEASMSTTTDHEISYEHSHSGPDHEVS
ncbi:MAG: hypothetical protein KDJ35_09495 [Alphaproteobacteria bacterium]|nr:hypothetical protein [Alphaproteobacteria bacterium]